jgi:hypothetical protein
MAVELGSPITPEEEMLMRHQELLMNFSERRYLGSPHVKLSKSENFPKIRKKLRSLGVSEHGLRVAPLYDCIAGSDQVTETLIYNRKDINSIRTDFLNEEGEPEPRRMKVLLRGMYGTEPRRSVFGEDITAVEAEIVPYIPKITLHGPVLEGRSPHERGRVGFYHLSQEGLEYISLGFPSLSEIERKLEII